MPSPKGAKHHKVNQDAYARVIKSIMQEPRPLRELEEITGLHLVTLQRLFRTLKRHGLVHITAWEPDSRGRDTSPVFAFGRGRDKEKFRMSRAEIARRYRERQKRKKAMEVFDNIIRGAGNEKHTNPEACAA